MMIVQEGLFATDMPGRYILKLCKHFRHKVPAEFDETRGRVDFQPGVCLFTAHADVLHMRIEGDTEETIGRMRYILEDHIQRMARVDTLDLRWHTMPAGPGRRSGKHENEDGHDDT